ncbi:MAG: hypothetical protein ACRDHL_15250, partial [Candidatus Promineifilaceae bacterium]
MAAARQRLGGYLLRGSAGAALILDEGGPAVMVSYALPLLDSGQILPELVLDDWGREIKGLALYAWLREQGQRFPRAEVFGFDSQGDALQCFVREIDLTAGLPLYAHT